jgi:hypothetical protein
LGRNLPVGIGGFSPENFRLLKSTKFEKMTSRTNWFKCDNLVWVEAQCSAAAAWLNARDDSDDIVVPLSEWLVRASEGEADILGVDNNPVV